MTLDLASAQFEKLRMGTLIVTTQPTVSSLPLEHTDVTAQVYGPLASVAVTQRFGNPFPNPIEVAYLFPLPHEAAIVDFEMWIGQRVIRGEMQELETARETYATARTVGKRAGLLEQRRPNLFSVGLANIQPGEAIITTVRYHERLRYDDGFYQFVFPMGITPKFHADPAEAAAVDAPIAAGGEPIGPVELNLAVDAGATVGEPHSPSHQIELTRLDSRRFNLRLPGHVLPNKDFVLRYEVAEETIRAAAWTATSDGGSVALVTALPPRLDAEIEPAPREFVFVIDRSGSMSGGPLDQARNALRACLRSLGPDDSFTIQAFDDRIEWLTPNAQRVTQAAVEQADRWLGQIDARGGTDIVSAIEAALKLPADSERQRYIVFLTDGAVSAEEVALSKIQQHLVHMRLFTFGIGPSVNRGLLARMAELGRGTAEFLQLDEDIEAAILRFQDRVAYPVLQDIQLAWEGATAWDIYPARLPDLYNGQPLELVARFQRTNGGRLVITGRRDREPIRLEVDLPTPSDEPIIASAWARARVTALLDAIRDDQRKLGSLRGEIIGLSIQHRVLTPYTAFVTVDHETPTTSADAVRVEIAQALPEGLVREGFRGKAQGFAAGSIPMPISAPAPTGAMPAPARPVAPPPPPQTSGVIGTLFRDLKQKVGRGRAGKEQVSAPYPEPYPAAEKASGPPTPEQPRETEEVFSLADLGLSADEIASLDSPSTNQAQFDAQEIARISAGESTVEMELREQKPTGQASSGRSDEILRGLARTQNMAGSWGSGAEEVEMTAAALLAFVRAGHTPRIGHYRRQLARALKWLQAAEATNQWAAQARAHALAEMAAALDDDPLRAEADAALAALPQLQVPTGSTLASLDDLRGAALTKVVRPVAPELLRNGGLVTAWVAALLA